MNKKLLTFVGMIMASVMAQVSADEVRSSILIFWNEEKLSQDIKNKLAQVSFADIDVDTTKTDAAFNEFCAKTQKIETAVEHNGNTDTITLVGFNDIKIAVTATEKGITVKALSGAANDALWTMELPIQPA